MYVLLARLSVGQGTIKTEKGPRVTSTGARTPDGLVLKNLGKPIAPSVWIEYRRRILFESYLIRVGFAVFPCFSHFH